MSGASVILRSGIQMLLQDAQAGQFDIVLADRRASVEGMKLQKVDIVRLEAA
ncbi:hypothetical protein [Amaricoccus sp.]|uniref:hypothetical protein n=1 Tax=Amaricoccus sp. TaxID=1872485 RepID=UPI0039E2329E